MVPEYKTKIGFIFGLKKEMDLLKYRHPEILYSHGYGELSKQATKKLIDSGVGIAIEPPPVEGVVADEGTRGNVFFAGFGKIFFPEASFKSSAFFSGASTVVSSSSLSLFFAL